MVGRVQIYLRQQKSLNQGKSLYPHFGIVEFVYRLFSFKKWLRVACNKCHIWIPSVTLFLTTDQDEWEWSLKLVPFSYLIDYAWANVSVASEYLFLAMSLADFLQCSTRENLLQMINGLSLTSCQGVSYKILCLISFSCSSIEWITKHSQISACSVALALILFHKS